MAEPSAPPVPAPPPLVGREREQTALREALSAALAGRGALVLIGGEAGIGKTALAEALLAEAMVQGAMILVGRCYDLAETPPYGPWREALARAPRGDGLPSLPTALLHLERDDGAALTGQDAIFRRVEIFLAALAARTPLVLLLDDLHWADPASLDLLRVVARGLAETPLLLLATYRADELSRHHALYSLLPILVRETRATRLDLRPLSQEALLALVDARYSLPADATMHLATYLAGRTDGNPLFTGELLRAVEEAGTLAHGAGGWSLGDLAAVGVPPLLRQVIDTRVDRVGCEYPIRHHGGCAKLWSRLSSPPRPYPPVGYDRLRRGALRPTGDDQRGGGRCSGSCSRISRRFSSTWRPPGGGASAIRRWRLSCCGSSCACCSASDPARPGSLARRS